MFIRLHDRSSRSMVEQSSIEFAAYTQAYEEWRYNYKGTLRWGQYLCDKFKITEDMAPGLYNAPTFYEAARIFRLHFNLAN